MPCKPNIAIDGPAGSGKSTVARELAHRLGFLYVDTGAMYRAVTYFAIKTGTDVEDEEALKVLVKGMRFSLIRYTKDNTVTLWCNGEDVTPYLREKAVAGKVSKVAAATSVREYLVEYQQLFARTGGVVMEGRDIGTVVLPDAEYKFFLTASLDERLKRRGKELRVAGREWTKEELRREFIYRDEMDSKREVGPLKKAPDALVIDSTDLIMSQVIEKILESYGGG